MIKKISLYSLFIAITAVSCNFGQKPDEYAHQKAKVREVIQTTNYTYLRVEKSKQDQWIAIGKSDIKEGSVIYFEDGLQMVNFESPELGRTFESILFVQQISDKPIKHGDFHGEMPEGMGEMGGMDPAMMGDKPEKPVIDKIEIELEHPAGAIKIGDLYARRSEYAGKQVTVHGKVIKVNVGIMGKNWLHIQDGTSDGDNFDLTITTIYEPAVGAVVTYSGTLAVKKDFGYGYFYEIIVEDAEPVKAL
ncbi:MAG TPA: GW dipeptide domain-containing protein [Bacteroidales bacterium]|nr:GW dipeptide domain-containing protein [Bacteroidales bacterium]